MQMDSVNTMTAFLSSLLMLERLPFIRYAYVLLLANTNVPYNGVRESESVKLHILVLRIAHLKQKLV
jgi:hypothetical protein